MIIVEGPDGSGKTTLIKELERGLRLRVQPRVVKEDTTTDIDLREWVEQDLFLNATDVRPRLYDRHRLISETIYGPIFRNLPEPGFSELQWMSEQLFRFYALKPTVIYCIPPMQTVIDNLKDDPKNVAVVDKTAAIYSSYLTRGTLDALHNNARTLVWDYTESNKDDMDRLIDHVLRLSQERNIAKN